MLFDRGRLVTLKVPSTPDDLTRGIIAGIDELPAQTGIAADAVERFVYATTYATNLIVEGKSSRIGLVTTHGFRDVLEIGRASRKPHIYDIHWRPAPPLVPRKLRRTVRERIDNAGAVPEPPDEAETRAVLAALGAEGCEAIAVTFLHAYANPAHERRVAELAQEICPEVEVSISSEVVREFREFERTSTTVANAFIKRPLQGHLGTLRRELDRGEKLRVGPRSAGSVPGPACDGQGGEAATVTDCNLIAGQFNPGYFLAGARRLDTGCAPDDPAGADRRSAWPDA